MAIEDQKEGNLLIAEKKVKSSFFSRPVDLFYLQNPVGGPLYFLAIKDPQTDLRKSLK